MRIQKYKSYFIFFCMMGFVVGILYANMISKDYLLSAGIFNEYYLNQYMQTEIVAQEYIWYIVKARLLPIIGIIVLGCLKIRKAMVLFVLFWTGLLGGILTTAAVLKLGIKGMFLCLVAVFPQGIFYLAGYGILLWYLYTYPGRKWNYMKTIAVILLIVTGMIAESYINPILMKMFLKTI